MIAIIDYKTGNLMSVENALSRLGADFRLTADPKEIREASHVILPGVGNAAEAMANLRESGLVPTILRLRKPVLGICVGMQIMCRHSEEGDVECMGIFDAFVRKFVSAPGLKVPHTGWNNLSNLESRLFKGIGSGCFVYFVHSYYAGLCPDTIATADQGGMFSAALKYENFYGVQFHPEKSGEVGEHIIRNFIEL